MWMSILLQEQIRCANNSETIWRVSILILAADLVLVHLQ